MSLDYTQMLNDCSFYGDEEDDEVFRFLMDNSTFRSFGDGLSLLLKKSGYSGDLKSVSEKTNYLNDRLNGIHSQLHKKTIKSWFDGEKRPKIQHSSRQTMFEICFALKLSIDDVHWFFKKVYLDRCFNYHQIDEAVYFFCLKNNYPYAKAREIIGIVQKNDTKIMQTSDVGINYTQYVKDQIDNFASEDELINFLISQRNNFETWNNNAYNSISELFNIIVGKSEDSKQVVKKLKKEVKNKRHGRNDIDTPDIEKCGLLLKEIIWDAKHSSGSSTVCDYINEVVEKEQLFTYTFFLKQMCINPKKSFKNTKIPFVVSNNFPSYKVLSEVLNNIKVKKSESYDSIRKVLVMLHFYKFWCEVKIEDPDTKDYYPAELYDIYREEINCLLFEAGYEDLYPGNPYDWVFLYSAQTENPLDFIREIMSKLMENEV